MSNHKNLLILLTCLLVLVGGISGDTTKSTRSINDRNDGNYGASRDRYGSTGPRRYDGYYDSRDKQYGSDYGYGSTGYGYDKHYGYGEGGYGFAGGYPPTGGHDYGRPDCCGGSDSGHYPSDHYPNGGHYPSGGSDYDQHLINEHKKAVIKGALLPLAGVALLGVAAALAANPVLLQLGVVSAGKKRKRRSLRSTLLKRSAQPYKLRSKRISTDPYRGHDVDYNSNLIRK